ASGFSRRADTPSRSRRPASCSCETRAVGVSPERGIMATYAIPGSPYLIETSPGSTGVVEISLGARNSFNLTAAGVDTHVDVSGCAYPALTADVAGQISALTTIVQTAANVSL